MSKFNFIYGLHAVLHLANYQPQRLLNVYIAKDRTDKKIDVIKQKLNTLGIAFSLVSQEVLDKKSASANHQGVLAECKPAAIFTEKDLPLFLTPSTTPVLFLILDQIQDPHNLGACFRSADAFATTAIIAPKDKSASLSAIVSKVASGAAEIIPFIQVTNLVRTMESMKEAGIWIYGADSTAQQTIYQTDFTTATAIVLGAEGVGLRRLTREKCDGLVSIPLRGTVQSLNVSVATGIILSEVQRQRITM